jgi:hypothetical protein
MFEAGLTPEDKALNAKITFDYDPNTGTSIAVA